MKILLHVWHGAPVRRLFTAVVEEHRDGDRLVLTVHDAAVFSNWLGLRQRLQTVEPDVRDVAHQLRERLARRSRRARSARGRGPKLVRSHAHVFGTRRTRTAVESSSGHPPEGHLARLRIDSCRASRHGPRKTTHRSRRAVAASRRRDQYARLRAATRHAGGRRARSDDWLHEVKYDGFRMGLVIDARRRAVAHPQRPGLVGAFSRARRGGTPPARLVGPARRRSRARTARRPDELPGPAEHLPRQGHADATSCSTCSGWTARTSRRFRSSSARRGWRRCSRPRRRRRCGTPPTSSATAQGRTPGRARAGWKASSPSAAIAPCAGPLAARG